MTEPLHIVVLAAGQGKRMRSSRPKVLQPLAGRPMLAHVLEVARTLDPDTIHVVHGHGGDQVREAFASQSDLSWIHQAEQLGTGHAVQVAMNAVPDEARVLVLLGDAPLVTGETLQDLVDDCEVGVITAIVADATGYGRIIRGIDGNLQRIVEHRDAGPDELQIHEVNSGMMIAPARALRSWLGQLQSNNSQGEFYLTDVVALARAADEVVSAFVVRDPEQILGANSRLQLAELERLYQGRQVADLCDQGAVVMDPARLDVRGKVQVGEDVTIDVNVVLEGDVQLADGVVIGPHCVVRDCRLGPGTRIHSHSHLDGVVTEGDCDIGPFARLRPGTRLGRHSRIGNFVETKKAEIGIGSKVNHLSYVGDSLVGSGVNIGAGTITCNYDGVNKHRTIIGDQAFIGSGTQLVAPVEVGAGATIGAGSTITKPAPEGELTVSRSRQITVKGWQKPVKKEP